MTNGFNHTAILRAPEVVEDVVRFTSADVTPRRASSEVQETLDKTLFARGFSTDAWQAA